MIFGMTYYTVKLRFELAGKRRKINEFIRPEYATNTSSHATRYDTIDEAEKAADLVSGLMLASGRLVYLGADFYKVK